ncbi:MAG: hypothetical protein OSA40_12910 [Phycisphaerales bacterium]|nr:hypothetical protein [Phycisphaerales bacterium]
MIQFAWPRTFISVFVGACILGCDRPVAEESGGIPETPAVDAVSPTDVGVDWQEGETGDGTWTIAWRPTVPVPPVSEPFSVEIRVTKADGSPPGNGIEIFLDAEMPHHGHGMNVVPRVTRRGDDWLVEGILMHMPGRWELSIDVIGEDETERSQWTVQLAR